MQQKKSFNKNSDFVQKVTSTILSSDIRSTLIIPAREFTNADRAAETHSIVIPTTVEAHLKVNLSAGSGPFEDQRPFFPSLFLEAYITSV